MTRGKRNDSPCTAPDCTDRGTRLGWCNKHYARWRRSGDPAGMLATERGTPWEQRYDIMPSGCWEWSGARYHHGYGAIRFGGQTRQAHRVAWERVNGPIPKGLIVRHFICDNPPCVNPEHLLLGTQGDNIRDRYRRARQQRT